MQQKKGFLHMLSLKNSSFIQSVKCLDIMLLCIVFVQSKICFRGEEVICFVICCVRLHKLIIETFICDANILIHEINSDAKKRA